MNKFITIRVPLAQFSYLEFDFEGTPEEAIIEHNRILKLYNSNGEGMTAKEMDTWVENMFLQKGNDADIYQKSTLEQKQELHRIKRALNRIKSRQGEDYADEALSDIG